MNGPQTGPGIASGLWTRELDQVAPPPSPPEEGPAFFAHGWELTLGKVGVYAEEVSLLQGAETRELVVPPPWWLLGSSSQVTGANIYGENWQQLLYISYLYSLLRILLSTFS